jgi:hypothetical protein
MEIAVLLAAGLRDWIDFGVIIGILLLNATVGWYQEKQAADVVASLKGDIAMRSTVVRDGQEQEIKARELVPGDIVRPHCGGEPQSHLLTSHRSLLKTETSSPLMHALFVLTMIPMATKNISTSSKLSAAILATRRTKRTMMDTRNTVQDTLFLPLINLP